MYEVQPTRGDEHARDVRREIVSAVWAVRGHDGRETESRELSFQGQAQVALRTKR